MQMSNDPGNEVSSLYPPPPPYVKFFTQSNMEKLTKYKENKAANTNKATSVSYTHLDVYKRQVHTKAEILVQNFPSQKEKKEHVNNTRNSK